MVFIMKRVHKIIFFLFVIIGMPVGVVSADNQTVDDVTNEDVVLFGDDLEITESGVVNGDVSLFGGEVSIAGRVNGDVVLFGGDLVLAESAVISGDCVTMGGSIDGEGDHDCVTAGQFESDLIGSVAGNVNDVDELPNRLMNRDRSAGRSLFQGILSAVAMGLIGLAVGANYPTQLNRVSQTIQTKPKESGLVGFLTAVAAPSLIGLIMLISTPLLLLFGLGLIGYVVAIGLILLLLGASLFGWVSMGEQVAERWGGQLKVTDKPFAQQVAIGTGILTAVYMLITALLPADIFWWILFVSLGLGAVALTKFGQNSYPRTGIDLEDLGRF